MIQASSQSRHAVGELVGERPLPGLEARRSLGEGAVESTPPLRLQAYGQRRVAAGDGIRQSSMPFVGEEGTAISREGIRPAR